MPLPGYSVADLLESMGDSLKTPQQRISTGWPILDNVLWEEGTPQGGFVFPSLVVIGGGPQSCKSFFVQVFAERHVLQTPGWVFMYDLENGRQRFMRRLMYRAARVGNADLAAGLTPAKELQWKQAVERWTTFGDRFLVQTRRPVGPSDLKVTVKQVWKHFGPENGVLICDSFQKLGEDIARDERMSLNQWANTLEEIRSELGILVIATSEVSRSASTKKTKEYVGGITDFKGTSRIEYSADLALQMNRKHNSEEVVLGIVKGRDGEQLVPAARYTPVRPFYELREDEL